MINLVNSSGQTAYDIQTYVLDTEEDLIELKKEKPKMGSTAYVIESQKGYIFNSKGETTELPEGGASIADIAPQLKAYSGWGSF